MCHWASDATPAGWLREWATACPNSKRYVRIWEIAAGTAADAGPGAGRGSRYVGDFQQANAAASAVRIDRKEVVCSGDVGPPAIRSIEIAGPCETDSL